MLALLSTRIVGTALCAAIPAGSAVAAETHLRLDGTSLGLVWIAPFIGLLLSMAVLPLAVPSLWHRHYGKLTFLWATGAVVPMALIVGPMVTVHELIQVALADYVPFIVLLTALYAVAGGIRLSGNLGGTPMTNAATLGAGTLLAGWVGTTGASMLMIRTVITANQGRRHQTHVIIFFIFLVSNIGGALSPLGDPPLFLGFLRGIDFFWPTVNLLPPTAMTAAVLLGLFFMIDSYFFRREQGHPAARNGNKFRVDGAGNFAILTAIIIIVMLSGKVDFGQAFEVIGVSVALDDILRDLALVGLAALSVCVVSPECRVANNFNWGPMAEVAKIFAGIFVTIIPVLAILRAGHDGAMRHLLAGLTHEGQPVDKMYFLLTGLLSSFLDNAPTYLLFFNAAGGDPQHLMGPLATTLMAISLGAVYMGANTYIGNAPNFMVKAIAEAHGVRMPSFFGYILWSIVILAPIFAIVAGLFL
ncbi:MAG: sodium:proton antiporter [Proteobacteria bacterium]|nr:sodium:proton antiporter [Pseudomonadota bacterium]